MGIMLRSPHTLLLLALVACQPASDARKAPPRTDSQHASSARALPDTVAATAFVRHFYAEYAPRAQVSGLAATDSLLLERPALFAPSLLASLQEDAKVRAAAVGEIDGLDFEPFLNSQDPCGNYTVGPATSTQASKPDGVVVFVRAACDRARGPEPGFSVEVALHAGAWQFVNVYYGPPAGDLVALLRRLHPPAV
jgi:hypothetical protein